MRLFIACSVAVLMLGCPDYKRRGVPDGQVELPDAEFPIIQPPKVVSPFPGSGRGGDPGMGVLFLLRLDRPVNNLDSTYAWTIRELLSGLVKAGFYLRTTAVGSLYDGNLFWNIGSGEQFEVIFGELAANAPIQAPLVCPTASLASLGEDLASQQVLYPPSYDVPFYPFAEPIAALMVVVLDHGDRPVAHDGAGCLTAGTDPGTYFGANAQTSWLNTTQGWRLPRLQTRFVFIASGEQRTYEQEREHCVAQAAFPRDGLDAVEPSELTFYDPLVARMNGYQPNLATRLDLCSTLGSNIFGLGEGLAKAWIEEMKAAIPK